MKKILLLFGIFLGFSFSAQNEIEKKYVCKKFCKKDKHFNKLGNLNEKDLERLKTMHNMSLEEKIVFLNELKINKILEKLNLLNPDQREWTKIKLGEYLNSLEEIKKSFKPYKNMDSISNEDAYKMIQEGLEIAQKLLDNRKKYTEIFLEKLTPKQVIEIHKTEKVIMENFKKYKDKAK